MATAGRIRYLIEAQTRGLNQTSKRMERLVDTLEKNTRSINRLARSVEGSGKRAAKSVQQTTKAQQKAAKQSEAFETQRVRALNKTTRAFEDQQNRIEKTLGRSSTEYANLARSFKAQQKNIRNATGNKQLVEAQERFQNVLGRTNRSLRDHAEAQKQADKRARENVRSVMNLAKTQKRQAAQTEQLEIRRMKAIGRATRSYENMTDKIEENASNSRREINKLNKVFNEYTESINNAKSTRQMIEAQERLDQAMHKANRRVRNGSGFNQSLADTVGRVTKNFNRLLGKLRVMSFVLGTVGAAVMALREELAALAAIAGGILVNVQLEPFRRRLRSVTDGVEELNGMMDMMADVADNAQTRLTAIGGGFSELIAAGKEAGNSVELIRAIGEGFAISMSSLGRGADDINSKLEDLAGLTKQGKLTFEDLHGTVESFANDPMQVLADAFDISEERVRKLMESNRVLSQKSLVNVSNQLRSQAEMATNLTGEWNRMITILTEVGERFNELGVISSVTELLRGFEGWLQSSEAEKLMRSLAATAERLLTETLPNLATSVHDNWNTIVNSISAAIGFLIGSAAGGVPGGILGAFIGSTEKSRKIFMEFTTLIASDLFGLGKDMTESESKIVDWGNAFSNVTALALDSATAALKVIGTLFESAGRSIGAFAARMAAYARGDVQAANQIMIEAAEDQQAIWSSLIEDTDFDKYRDKLAEINKEMENMKENTGGKDGKNNSPVQLGAVENVGESPAPEFSLEDLWQGLSESEAQKRAQQITDAADAIGSAITNAQSKISQQQTLETEGLGAFLSKKGSDDATRSLENIRQQLGELTEKELKALGSELNISASSVDGFVEAIKPVVTRGNLAEEAIRKMKRATQEYSREVPDATAELERLRTRMDAFRRGGREAMEEVTDATKIEQAGQEMRKLAENVARPTERLRELKQQFPRLLQGASTLPEALRRIGEEGQRLKNDLGGDLTQLQQFADGFGQSVGDAFGSLITGAESSKDVFNDLIKSVTDLIIQLTVVEPLAKGIARQVNSIGASSGAGGGLGSFFSSLAGNLFGGGGFNPASTGATAAGIPQLIPGFASGGKFPAGQSMLVGEEGPEVVRFSRSGTVVSNDDIGEGSGSGSGGRGAAVPDFKVEIINNGEPMEVQETSSRRNSDNEQVYRMIVGRMARDVGQENGPMAKTLQGTYNLQRGGTKR